MGTFSLQAGVSAGVDSFDLRRLFLGEAQFKLGRQLRRSDGSVPANIFEGWTKRNSSAEFKRHLMIASGEAAETRYWIEMTIDEGLAVRKPAEDLLKEYAKLGFM